MSRRRALTEAQLQTLFDLPTTEADLIRHWTLAGCSARAKPFLKRRCVSSPTQLGADPKALTGYASRFQTR